MLNRWNASLLMIGMGTLVSVLLITTTYWNWRQQLTRSTADLLVRNLTANQAPPQIVIVGIDDASLNNTTGFGRLTEWDRGLYAKLLDQLHKDQARRPRFCSGVNQISQYRLSCGAFRCNRRNRKAR